jgi:hypothetical protein
MRRIIVLLGLPCSGKSSVGKALQTKGFHYEGEMATSFMMNGLKVGSDAPRDFDRVLMKSEFERDANRSSEFTVIETWHPGNLAYARVRSPEVANEYEGKIAECFRNYDVRAIYFDLSVEKSQDRAKVAHPALRYDVAFFSKVKIEMETLLKNMNSAHAVLDSNIPLELLSKQALAFVSPGFSTQVL